MKEWLCLLCIVLFVAGCVNINTKKQVLKNRIEDITPKGCSYDIPSGLFDCISKEQETYLDTHPFTAYELENMGYTVGMQTSLVVLTIMKLHECTMDMQESTFICTYEWSTDLVSIFSEEVDVKQSFYNGKHLYTFFKKPPKS